MSRSSASGKPVPLARVTTAVNAAAEPEDELSALAHALVLEEVADACRIYPLEPEPDKAGRVTAYRLDTVADPALRARCSPPDAGLLARGELLLGGHGEWLR